ncbi:MAG: DNA polymerase/3'-5' exonuclease PolX [Bacteroidales bacterium]|nr:DNA polymerase/3'-5' exonuclease PolX [Bacteroidales bacterium]
MKDGISVEIRLVSEQQFPFEWLYSTGSDEFYRSLQTEVQKLGFKIDKNGLLQNGAPVTCSSEKDIFEKLGMSYIPPALRENSGEIQSAIKRKIPQLIEVGDIKGVIHVHSNYSDGIHSIRELAAACQQMGYDYLVISDHSKAAAYARGLSEERIKEQLKEIDELNQEFQSFKVLKSIECDILPDGQLDYEENILKLFDLVIASIHSKFNMTESEATKRLIAAMTNPFVTIIGHPTGRLLLAREGYPVNLNELIGAAAEQKVALELNANPHRLDLDWRYLREAKEQSIKISINPDAHRIEGIADIRYGVGIAGKGWLTRQEVLNCMSSEEILQFASRRRNQAAD